MMAGTIYNQLVTTLRESPILDYIKYVHKGIRRELEADSFPCIMVEPTSDGESLRQMNNVEYLYFRVNLIAFSQSYTNPEDNIVGTIDRKGILDINNDIRAVLADSYQLGCNATEVRPENTNYDYSMYPNRGLTMSLKILYKQTNNV